MSTDVASRAREAIEERRSALIALSEELHGAPELAFEEHRAVEATTAMLAQEGFEIKREVAGLPTAFDAVFGSGPLSIAVIAEYDALPDVGHACGHNLIASAGVGAGIGLRSVADELGLTVHVLGTPAEEGGGGKVIMLDAGVFDEVNLAMMIHPWSFDRLNSTCLAVDHFDVTFTGRTAHASAAPAQGINAGDAMTIAQVAIGLLRQQLPAGDQVHGIVTVGGEAANIIPARVTGRFMCRSLTISGLERLRPRVQACFEAGALATGCELDTVEIAPIYSHMEQDPELLAFYRHHAEAMGRTFGDDDRGAAKPTYSTDMANVSLALPSIHPLVGIETNGAVNHQPEFAAACIGPSAEQALMDGAIALALTGVDAATSPTVRDRLLSSSIREKASNT
jgi:amidohydrolase